MSPRMRKHLFHIFLWTMIIVIVILAGIGSYGIFSLVQPTYRNTHHFLGQVLYFMLGEVLFMILFYLIGRLFHRRFDQRFEKVRAVLEAISKGNFNVSIDQTEYEEQEYKDVIISINEMVKGLSNLETMRQDFISNVSHEIQSPLTSIGGFARALKENEHLSQDLRVHYLDIIESETSRLSQLSDHLLKLSTLEKDGTESLEPRNYRLDKQIRRMILACESQWSAKDLQIDVHLDDMNICAEEGLLSQVWLNLLNNSIKFTPKGGLIEIRSQLLEEQVVIRVVDSGVGIEATDLPYIFDRFYKADKSRNREAGGNGLGLAIVKKIIDLHGGEIAVESTPLEGTVFIVTLPTGTA
ncbi:signal transduction histidine kinase [Paenibacillus shirakamiensis]|uniref:Heme sensor protein HssS n=1 Tax=Paenibacillus shirakamiensis TaxID=1265935 RepID=A0ABS4JGY7_9BACL|nr:HAMP domain-containing sensor histidine kinase [Paenibacillus shirakamiensis]MBP2000978.1 signal transduction histidine kinase [Paenibacillus shirakamiensis]